MKEFVEDLKKRKIKTKGHKIIFITPEILDFLGKIGFEHEPLIGGWNGIKIGQWECFMFWDQGLKIL